MAKLRKRDPASVRLFAEDRQRRTSAPLGRPALTWSHRQTKLIPAKGVVPSDMNFLNIRLAFDTDLSKGRTEGGCRGFSSSHRRLIRQEENRVLRY